MSFFSRVLSFPFRTLFFIPCTFSRSAEFKSMRDCMLTLLVVFSGSLALLTKWEKRSYPVSKGDFLFCIPLDGMLPCAFAF